MSALLQIKPGDSVFVIEWRGLECLLHNALIVRASMSESLRGPFGDMAIEAVYVRSEGGIEEMVRLPEVLHWSHEDYMTRKVMTAYDNILWPNQGQLEKMSGVRLERIA